MNNKLVSKIDLTSGLLLLGLAFVWGGSFFFAEIAITEIPPLTVALHRVFWALPPIFIVVLWKGLKIPLSGRAWFNFLIMGALNNALPFSLIFWAQVNIGSGLASILNGTTAVFGAVVAGILLIDEPLTVRKILGAFLGFLGVAVIMGIDALSNFNIQNLAQLAVLGAAFSYSFAGVWGKKYLSNYPPLVNAFGMLLSGTVILFPIALYLDGLPSLSLSLHVWSSVLGVAIISTAIAYFLYFEILARAGSANLMLVTVMIPPVAVTLSSTFLGEALPSEAWYGFIIIGFGLTITDGRTFDKIKASVKRRL
ncbi:MAG: DMT family transporter [Paracoccaceae bacterium]|nr:DMT family transporter [Paracoccaceae bacterium]